MKLIRLTALSSLVLGLMLAATSCEKVAEEKKTTDYERKSIPLTGAQETPATPSTALGFMDVSYSKETRILTFSVTWSGLTGPVAAMHIHGLAPVGYAAGVVQNLITASNGIATPGSAYPATGKFSATLLADGVIVKEQDLLNGMYYLNIHTATYPGGEIRGQIKFQ
ncbi:MAG: CHRD domain-containing protein [Sphingobacteriales bacterium]|nr:CHRD domain-containing protein [Sphingobacteriales bacterium]